MKTAKVVWKKKDLEFEAITGSGYRFDFSGRPDDQAASPMEVLLNALVGCTAMDVISILGKKRQQVSDFTVEVAAVRASEHPMVYTEADITYIVSGEDIDPAAVERAIELSMTKYCSVSIMLKQGGLDIRTEYRIE